MMSVQHLMQAVQTSKPRFLCCEINADRIVINGSRTAIKDSRTLPRILCYLLTDRTAINVTVPSSKSVQELMQRTAGNTPRNSCRN